jgi:hypothetical protein
MAVACCYDEHKREQQEHEPGALWKPHGGGSAFPPAIERRVKRRCEEHAEEEDLEMAAAE